jgi:hypothetical protein
MQCLLRSSFSLPRTGNIAVQSTVVFVKLVCLLVPNHFLLIYFHLFIAAHVILHQQEHFEPRGGMRFSAIFSFRNFAKNWWAGVYVCECVCVCVCVRVMWKRILISLGYVCMCVVRASERNGCFIDNRTCMCLRVPLRYEIRSLRILAARVISNISPFHSLFFSSFYSIVRPGARKSARRHRPAVQRRRTCSGFALDYSRREFRAEFVGGVNLLLSGARLEPASRFAGRCALIW